MAISATIIINIPIYIRKTLNLKKPICLYQKLQYCLNIISIIIAITSSKFKNFNFLVPSKINSIYNIGKTMIFVDSIKNSKVLRKYLQSLLPNKLKNRGEKIIKSFSSILKTKKSNCLEDFLNNNTRIIIYTDIVRIKFNIFG